MAGLAWRKSGRPTDDRAVTRCGCFLPDLTGLARRPSTADLPGVHIILEGGGGKVGPAEKQYDFSHTLEQRAPSRLRALLQPQGMATQEKNKRHDNKMLDLDAPVSSRRLVNPGRSFAIRWWRGR